MGGGLSGGGKGHQAVQRDRSVWGLGLAPLFITAAPWAVGLGCAASCWPCSSIRKGMLLALLPELPPFPGGVLWAPLWKWAGIISGKASEEGTDSPRGMFFILAGEGSGVVASS